MSVRKLGVVAALLVAGCEGTNLQPAATPPRLPLQTSPEIDALTKRAQNISTVEVALEIEGCSPGNQRWFGPTCPGLLASRGLANRAEAQLKFGRDDDAAKARAAEATLAQAEQALVAAMAGTTHPLSGADCMGQTGGERALAFQDSCGALDRVRAVLRTLDEAVRLDATDEAATTRRKADACAGDKQTCLATAKALEGQSKTGALAGEADILVRKTAAQIAGWSHGVSPYNDLVLPSTDDLALAEDDAKQAKSEAQRIADARAAAQAARRAKLAEESELIQRATVDCGLHPTEHCKSKCSGGDAAYCVTWGMTLWHAHIPKLADAKAAAQRACDAGFVSGCDLVGQVDADIQAQAAQVENLWASVVEVGDDLVQKYFVAEKLSKVANRPHLVRALEQMRIINQATVTERYCPARKAFVQGASAADFAKRAAAHCKDEAPTGAGLSGAEVTLTSQCQQVYASSCP
jgi:hypothetical protein